MEYNEADERQGLETGEIDVDALQAHADELGEMLQTLNAGIARWDPAGPRRDLTAGDRLREPR